MFWYSRRAWIEAMMGREVRGVPAVLVSEAATWTLNAFAGGYARALEKGGILADYAEEGVYRTLMEGLEAFCGLMDLGLDSDEGHASFNAETAGGRAYHSMLASDRTHPPQR